MDGWMDGRMDGSMDGWLDGWKWMDRCGWMDGCTDALYVWIRGGMGEWMKSAFII
jgi:hypothetical protein